jgi:hypothetical protein
LTEASVRYGHDTIVPFILGFVFFRPKLGMKRY